MPYTKTTFVNGKAPAVSAEELNKMGKGIEDLYNFVENDLVASSRNLDIQVAGLTETVDVPTNGVGNWFTFANKTIIKDKGMLKLKVRVGDIVYNSSPTTRSGSAYHSDLRIYINGALRSVVTTGVDTIIDIKNSTDFANLTLKIEAQQPSGAEGTYAHENVITYTNEIFDVS